MTDNNKRQTAMNDSGDVNKTALKKVMSLREALEVEEKIYQRLKKEIEDGLRAEGIYWQFLDANDSITVI